MTQRALVAGAGLIGSAAARALAGLGVDVTCADLDGGLAARGGITSARITSASADLSDPGTVRSLLRRYEPTLVVHAAGRTARAGDSPAALIAEAATLAWTVASESARAQVRRIVLVSSFGVYGGTAGPVAEDAVPVAVTAYGAAKLAAEAALTSAVTGTRTRWFIARLAGVYGGVVTGGGGRLNEALAGLLRQRLSGAPLVIPASLGGRELLYAGDAGAALARVAGLGHQGIYNIGTGGPASTNDIAAAFASLGARGTGGPAAHVTAEPDEPAASWLDVSKASRELGFAAPTKLADGLRAWAAAMTEPEDRPAEGALSNA